MIECDIPFDPPIQPESDGRFTSISRQNVCFAEDCVIIGTKTKTYYFKIDQVLNKLSEE